MHYVLKSRHANAWAETADGKVVAASANLRWAVGGALGKVMDWAASRGMRVYVSERHSAPARKVEGWHGQT